MNPSPNTMSGYIYLLQEREFIRLNETIYKIGRTKQMVNARISQYPKGTNLIFTIIVPNVVDVETELIKLFQKLYIPRHDIGKEHFEGDCFSMVNTIMTFVQRCCNSNSFVQAITNINGNVAGPSTTVINTTIHDADDEEQKLQTTIYACKRCLYTCDQKSNLRQHLSRKCPCKINVCGGQDIPIHTLLDELGEIREKQPNIECVWCKEKFSCSPSLSRHKKTCNQRPTCVAKKADLHNMIQNVSIDDIKRTDNVKNVHRPPYTCIRCGFMCKSKSDMNRHFYMRSKPCPATQHVIELTDEIKIHILNNRIIRLQDKPLHIEVMHKTCNDL